MISSHMKNPSFTARSHVKRRSLYTASGLAKVRSSSAVYSWPCVDYLDSCIVSINVRPEAPHAHSTGRGRGRYSLHLHMQNNQVTPHSAQPCPNDNTVHSLDRRCPS